MSLSVAVLGLGEAGGRIASDLVAAGCVVRGWDPAPSNHAQGVPRASSDHDAVAGADLVLSLTTAAHAVGGARSAAIVLTPEQTYGDLNTAAPAAKRELGAIIGQTGAAFADVALLGAVPARGLQTPALASGAGADRFASLVRPLGMPVEIVGRDPGAAAGLKLLRSVFMKGLAASVLESLAAAAACGAQDWLRREIVDVLNEPLVERLVSGTVMHAERRLHEMRDAAAYLEELGVEPRIAAAAAGWFEQLSAPAR
jgi:3-hydroxyisobutyrate dehydrogenase-like beta-hydroxyacid dehydrogenase